MTTSAIDWDEITEAGADVRGVGSVPATPPAPPAPPAPLLRGTRDYGQVVHQIRALLVLAVFLLAGLLLAVVSVGYDLHNGSGAVSTGHRVPLALYVPGPDPAADSYAHVVFADGTERDLGVGEYLTDRVVRVEFGVEAPAESPTSCRIVIDGVRVAEQTAPAGSATVCRWSAP